MSSGAKRRCALGVHCVIAALRAHDHTCDDWTEIQESDYTQRLTNLLLKVNRAVGETLHLAEDVRVELDYLAALDDDGRYRCVVMLVPVLNVLSYIPYIHVFFFFAARATPVEHIHSLHTCLLSSFVVCGACHSWGTAGWWSTGVAAHHFWRG